ncbi:MAG TPA: DUF1638 domain-containing protein [Desulfobacteria bacterium]|nr:DUF1638 domain-containing protein [Desulfobacteria bacterium]
MSEPKLLIACKVFFDELTTVLPDEWDYHPIWIDTGLHADLDKLEKNLLLTIDDALKTGREVKMLYGSGCHPDICRLGKKCGIGIPPFKNCIEAFCGAQTRELEKERTMIMTPGWIRAWPNIMAAQGWEAVDARINLGIYDRILVLEPGVAPLTDDEILGFFDIVQVPVEVQPLELDVFRQNIYRALENSP